MRVKSYDKLKGQRNRDEKQARNADPPNE